MKIRPTDGNWRPDIPPTSPSPSGRGVRGEGKNGEDKKIPIPPNIFKNARYLNEQGIRVVRFWSNNVLQQIDSALPTAGTVAGGSFALTPTPLPEGEGLLMTFPIG